MLQIYEKQKKMNNEALEKILKEIGEKDAKCKVVEVENELLKEQNMQLIRQNLIMKQIMEAKGIL